MREGFRIRTYSLNGNEALFEKYNIRRLPTYVYMIDGKEIRRASGLDSKARIRMMFRRPLF